MENSSPNPSFSICDFRIQKQMSRSFGKSFPQKIVLPKLRPHCSATCPNTWRAEPRKKNTLSFFKRNFTPAKSRKQGVFFFRGCRGSARQWRTGKTAEGGVSSKNSPGFFKTKRRRGGGGAGVYDEYIIQTFVLRANLEA